MRQEDGTWLLASSRSLAETTPLSGRIRPLHWMVGEWTFEKMTEGQAHMNLFRVQFSGKSKEHENTSRDLGSDR